jgi:DnaJ family protein C protein 9
LIACRKKKKSGESTSDLAALINHRGQKQMDSLASALAAKYGNQGKGSKGGKRSKPMEEPSEEEFLAAQKRVLKKSKK